MKNRIILMLSILFLITACDKDDKGTEPKVLSPTEAKSSINELETQLHSDLVEMVESKGATGLVDLADLLFMEGTNLRQVEPDFRKKEIEANIKKLGKTFSPTLVRKSLTSTVEPEVEEDEPFVFEDNLGIYEWNPAKNEFVKISSDVAYMSLHFPTKGSDSNNANFKLIKFETVQLLDEDLPKKIVAELYIEEALEASLNFDVDYSIKDVVESADINLYVSPFDYHLVLVNGSDKSSSLKFDIERDDTKIFGVEVDVEFMNTDKEDIKTIEGAISYREISISGNLLINELNNAQEDADINDFVNLAVYKNDAKLGDISFETEGGVYIVYSDGSKELLEEAFKSVLDEIETFVMAMNGEDESDEESN